MTYTLYASQAKKIEITITEPTIGPDQILKRSKTSKQINCTMVQTPVQETVVFHKPIQWANELRAEI